MEVVCTEFDDGVNKLLRPLPTRMNCRRLPRASRSRSEDFTLLLRWRHESRRRLLAASPHPCGFDRRNRFMRPPLIVTGVFVTGLALVGLASRTIATHSHGDGDFGSFVADVLADRSEQLFGIGRPLEESALGPYDGADNLQAIKVAQGLHVSLVSSSVASAADQIALWPDDDHPKFLFVCDEETADPEVPRVDLSKPAASNATTIVKGLSSCDPVRRTPWGTIIVAEEAGATGGLYELFEPDKISTAISVTDRDGGVTSDPRLVKRKAVGSLSFESFAIKED